METCTIAKKVHTSINREDMFRELYERAFPKIVGWAAKLGGSFQDTKDLFQDSLIILYENVVVGNTSMHTSPEAYIAGIFKHLWIRKFKLDRKKVPMEQWEEAIHPPEDYYSAPVNGDRLVSILERAGKKCMGLLRAFYYDKFSVSHLSRTFGYSNEHSVSVQKFKCLEKVRQIVKQKSIEYGDLTE